ncbi:glycosyltransferase family 4 protein [Desulfocurvus sp. DL9XJH121]
MPDLLFLTQSGENLPSVRFRVLPFVSLARERGIDAAWRRYPKTALARAAFFATQGRVQTVVLQKKLVSGLELSLLRSRSGRLLFDFDDALWAMHPNQGECGGKPDERELERLLRVCAGVDAVVAGNTFLADKVRGAAHRVDVLPTPLDTDVFTPGPAHSSRPVVGWMGTACNLFFLPEIFTALAPLAGAFDVSVVSDGDFALPAGFAGGFTRWTAQDELELLRSMDIGLMPLSDDEYTRGKCGFKLLQYMACGVVPVASDVGFNREIVTHGRDGFLAPDPARFAEYVEKLVRDPDLRADMAVRARETVVRRFGLAAAAENLWRILGV